MSWNWQQSDWPNFTWDRDALLRQEQDFLLSGGVLVGVAKHLSPDDWDQVRVQTMSEEAITTSEIEGEMLNRASVQSSIQHQLGLTTDSQRVSPMEQGISELMVSLYSTFDQPLAAEVLFEWHRMVMAGRSDVGAVGSFRADTEAMQVVSGATYAPKVHFEAPPSSQVSEEVDRFLTWFERTSPRGPEPLPAVTRAGIASLLRIDPPLRGRQRQDRPSNRRESSSARLRQAYLCRSSAWDSGSPSPLLRLLGGCKQAE